MLAISSNLFVLVASWVLVGALAAALYARPPRLPPCRWSRPPRGLPRPLPAPRLSFQCTAGGPFLT